jgi:hypothetical protein
MPRKPAPELPELISNITRLMQAATSLFAFLITVDDS